MAIMILMLKGVAEIIFTDIPLQRKGRHPSDSGHKGHSASSESRRPLLTYSQACQPKPLFLSTKVSLIILKKRMNERKRHVLKKMNERKQQSTPHDNLSIKCSTSAHKQALLRALKAENGVLSTNLSVEGRACEKTILHSHALPPTDKSNWIWKA